jgi:hypothetical protein
MVGLTPARHGSRDVGVTPPEVTPPTAATRGAEECGRSAARAVLSTPAKPAELLAKMAVARLHRAGDSGPAEVLTFGGCKAYILANSARRRLGATARLRSSSSIFGDKASDHGRKLHASTAFRLSGGGTAMVPGCLTGESEERETWTAESLRAASAIGACLRTGLRKQRRSTRLRRYTFQVNTLVVKAAGAGVSNRARA